MAVIKLPAFILSISGRMGDIVFYSRNNTQCVRDYVVPANPDTLMQRQNRSKFALAVKAWQSLDPERRLRYGRKAMHLNMSGYNLFLSEHLTAALNFMYRHYSMRKAGFSVISAPDQSPFHSVSTPYHSQSFMKTLPETVFISPECG